MTTAKVYYDADGNECTIYQMVKREPGWVASRLQRLERLIDDALNSDTTPGIHTILRESYTTEKNHKGE
jgi:hypothetical protein